MDVAPLAKVHSVLVQLSDNWIRPTLVTPRVSSGLPMVLASYTTLPSSSWPILLLIMLLAIAKGVVHVSGVTQASEIADCDLPAGWGQGWCVVDHLGITVWGN
jgi:hypothetical protein